VPTQDAATIRDAAGRCLARVTFTRRMRLLGVRAGGLARADAATAQAPRVREPTLFD
jgi:DNA polymerase-4